MAYYTNKIEISYRKKAAAEEAAEILKTILVKKEYDRTFLAKKGKKSKRLIEALTVVEKKVLINCDPGFCWPGGRSIGDEVPTQLATAMPAEPFKLHFHTWDDTSAAEDYTAKYENGVITTSGWVTNDCGRRWTNKKREIAISAAEKPETESAGKDEKPSKEQAPKEKEWTMDPEECTGKTFVITGKVHIFKNRDEFSEYVVKNGGIVSGSVTKNTNYLVNNDLESSSSKNMKAKELGIPIITEEQFVAKFKSC